MMMNRPELFKQEARSAGSVGSTLARFGEYFGKFWYMLVFALVLVVVSTWSQVTTPELTGQATDCFLVPNGVSSFGSFTQEAASNESTKSSCWLASDPKTLSGTQWI